MTLSVLRWALVMEFVVVLTAVFIVWSEVAGPDQFDLVPWHWKLVLGVGIALAAVLATASAMTMENAWNPRTMAWMATLLAFLVLMGALTFYFAQSEPVEEEETLPMSSASWL